MSRPSLESDGRRQRHLRRHKIRGDEPLAPKTAPSEADRLATAADLLSTLARPGVLKLLGALGQKGSMDGEGLVKALKGVARQSKPLDRLVAAGLVCASPDGVFHALTADGRRAWMGVRGLVD
jgi:hypothetical protein